MDAETEAETRNDDDCQAQQNIGSSVSEFDHQLLCQQQPVNIQLEDSSDETSVESLNNTAVTDSYISGSAKLGEIGNCEPLSEEDLEIQSLPYHSNFGNNHTSDELKAETRVVMKDTASAHCFVHFDSAQDEEISSDCLRAEHIPVAECHKSESAGHCDSDDRGEDQSHKYVSAGHCESDDRGEGQSHESVSAGHCDRDDRGEDQSHRCVSAGYCDSDDHGEDQSHKCVSAGPCDSDDGSEDQSHRCVSARRCDSDDHGGSRPMLASECNETKRTTADTNQLGDLCSDTDLSQCFMVSRPDSHCSSNSLQDAFMQFLKKKQVS